MDFAELISKELIALWDKMYERYDNSILDLFSEPEEGEPLSIIYKGRSVSNDLALSLYEYFTLTELLEFSTIESIFEIGSGYGRTAYVIKKLHPNIKYTIFDLEPCLNLSKRYLGSVIQNNDIAFKNPDSIDGHCNLLLAIDCLHEMTPKTVKHYFDMADKVADSFYFSCWKETVLPEGITWKQKDYPVKDSWRQLMSREHGIRKDYFEEFYEC